MEERTLEHTSLERITYNIKWNMKTLEHKTLEHQNVRTNNITT